eukprot:CAMPEP_0201595074 /NCGR_PEP_ID=MMETSP0190_2-20130828/192199_1 /ASSEMBLY_ACC=CAM_ASM_000263 /TAXON_ID=37353 /ORGANISM="Rosalina sp." /LENGTH=97 /DNA_ID=CAMNT_0048054937 /DNA_START=842 /DNA_END=1135 /DNA_ORIENTATION=+
MNISKVIKIFIGRLIQVTIVVRVDVIKEFLVGIKKQNGFEYSKGSNAWNEEVNIIAVGVMGIVMVASDGKDIEEKEQPDGGIFAQVVGSICEYNKYN